MSPTEIADALREIAREADPTLKHLRLASLVSALFHERGVELIVVGGSAIEFYTDGGYVSGDLDFCLLQPPQIGLRMRQEVMGLLDAKGGPRSWQVAGQYVDLLGEVETFAPSEMTEIQGPYGMVRLISPEDLLVERVLVSVYPQPNPHADACARKLAASGILGHVEINWNAARMLAALPEYRIVEALEKLTGEVANDLGRKNPYHTEGPPH